MRTTVVVVLAGLSLLSAGCAGNQQAGTQQSSSATATTTPSPAADQGKVAFADDICGAVAKFLVPATSIKTDTSSPAAALASIKTQLGTLSQGLTEASDDLKNADTGGVPDGQAAVADVQKTFGQLKEAVDRAKMKLDGVNPNDQQAVTTAMQSIGTDLAGLSNLKNPLDQPSLKSADMQAAAQQAPKCQQMKGMIEAKAPSSAPSS
jgi:hypothetical protein